MFLRGKDDSYFELGRLAIDETSRQKKRDADKVNRLFDELQTRTMID